MQEITFSLRNNILKLSYIEKGEFRSISAEILDDSNISDTIKDLFKQLSQKSINKFSYKFIVEPEEMEFKFVTVSKNVQNLSDEILKDVSSRLEGTCLDDMYFSYQKIAPFVYQFIGIKKSSLDKCLDISMHLGGSLRGVFSWNALLPKFSDTNVPSIFLSNLDEFSVITLSEFGGVFYANAFDEKKHLKDLGDVVNQLSMYKREDPITKVYLHNKQEFNLNGQFEISDLKIPRSDEEATKGFDVHLIVDYVLDTQGDLYSSQLNLLNLLPVPALVERKSSALVYVGSFLVGILLVAGIASVVYFKPFNLGNNQEAPVVLSESTPATPVEENNTSEEVKPELKREELSIQVQNGAGIAGIAGKTAELLAGLGYKKPEATNAAIQNRVSTIIKIKDTKKDYAKLLEEDMKDKFQTITETDLDENSPFDVIITVGSDAKL